MSTETVKGIWFEQKLSVEAASKRKSMKIDNDIQKKYIFCGMFDDFSEAALGKWIVEEFEPDEKEKDWLRSVEILAADGDDGGYEGEAWFLFRDENNDLWEVSGSHCSCNSFAGQFDPRPSFKNYLLSDKCPGTRQNNAIKNFLMKVL